MWAGFGFVLLKGLINNSLVEHVVHQLAAFSTTVDCFDGCGNNPVGKMAYGVVLIVCLVENRHQFVGLR